MSRRTLAGLLVLPMLIALWVAALVLPLPYVVYSPGVTVDVLGKEDGEEIIRVTGHETFRDDGELRMTTVFVTQPQGRVNLFEVVGAWLDPEQAVYPFDAIYSPEETNDDARRRSAVQMVSSQDAATAVALTELGIDFEKAVEVLDVAKDMPAEGEFEVGDLLLTADGAPIDDTRDVLRAVKKAGEGTPMTFQVLRDGKTREITVTPVDVDGTPRIGITPGPGFEFPFTVDVGISDSIGGPSAGLMFSLGIYDTLTPGSLTGDAIVAGTGTIAADGAVGPIGGIQQKVVAARDAGAELFLVPPDNCADALRAPNGDMELVKATTMHEARAAIEAWVKDPDADLPACTSEDSADG